jgi:hypothetical protein
MRVWACLVLFVLLGCSRLSERSAAVSTPAAVAPAGPSASFAWARSDGQRMAGNPDLIAHAQADIAACQAEAPPRAAKGVPGEPCMRERGYYIRPVD